LRSAASSQWASALAADPTSRAIMMAVPVCAGGGQSEAQASNIAAFWSIVHAAKASGEKHPQEVEEMPAARMADDVKHEADRKEYDEQRPERRQFGRATRPSQTPLSAFRARFSAGPLDPPEAASCRNRARVPPALPPSRTKRKRNRLSCRQVVSRRAPPERRATAQATKHSVAAR
jgi:hypothetical protein